MYVSIVLLYETSAPNESRCVASDFEDHLPIFKKMEIKRSDIIKTKQQ